MHTIIYRMERLDELIRVKSTGTPVELAERIGISQRSLYEYLSLMKELGAPIRYSRTQQTYHYLNEGRFTISFLS